MKKIPYKTYLPEEKLPQAWYNLRADMPEQPAPMLHPGTLEPMTAEQISPVFIEECSRQEMDSGTRYIDIPGQVMDYYKTYRPSPLCRAYHLEKALDTPAKIYYKFEGNNTSGSHKLNSAIAQAYYAKKQGLEYLATETGAGQWGTALSMACAYFDLDLRVYMVKGSMMQKPYRKTVMETYAANVFASPSDTTAVGRKLLEEHPGTTGSLGCAISEAIEAAMGKGDKCRYALGSVLNHVLLHQSVVGLEAKAAMEMLGEYPDIVIGCAGGGSNLGGLMSPFIQDKLLGKRSPEFLAVEPASCPSLTRGKYAYDFGDTGRTTPLLKMYTLGSNYIPHPNHAGGLRFHGMSPILSKLRHDGFIGAAALPQKTVFEAAALFAKCETILPAPESAHAIRAAIDEAVRCKESGEAKTILFCLSGTGYFDMTAYSSYLEGTMTDHIPAAEELEAQFASLPAV
jgi:tryptophan synthase beta chain